MVALFKKTILCAIWLILPWMVTYYKEGRESSIHYANTLWIIKFYHYTGLVKNTVKAIVQYVAELPTPAL